MQRVLSSQCCAVSSTVPTQNVIGIVVLLVLKKQGPQLMSTVRFSRPTMTSGT